MGTEPVLLRDTRGYAEYWASVWESSLLGCAHKWLFMESLSTFCSKSPFDRFPPDSTHAFYAAVSGGCVPVIVSDVFGEVALPFGKWVKLEDFSVSIKEREFLERPWEVMRILRDIPEAVMRGKVAGLVGVQRALLYRHPRSVVGGLVVASVQ